MLDKTKENKFPMTSSMRLHSNDISWATTNQSARKIHHIVSYIWLSISYFIYNQLSLTRTPLDPVLSVGLREISRENFGCQFYRGVCLIEVSVKRESIVVSSGLKRNCHQGSHGSFFFNTSRPFITRKVKIPS